MGSVIDVFGGVHGRYGVDLRNLEECLESFVWRKNCMCQVHGLAERKVAFKLRENENCMCQVHGLAERKVAFKLRENEN